MVTTAAKRRIPARFIVGIGMLAAISFVLSYIEITPPLSPSFVKLDISDLPAMLAAFIYGPLAGLCVEAIKNLLGLFSTSTGGIGELANFLMGGFFVLVAGVFYRFNRTRRGALLAMLAGSAAMAIVAGLANYFILLPLFSTFMPMDALIQSFGAFIPFIKTRLDVVLYSALPFNFLKGLLVSAITFLLYKRLRPILRGNTP